MLIRFFDQAEVDNCKISAQVAICLDSSRVHLYNIEVSLHCDTLPSEWHGAITGGARASA